MSAAPATPSCPPSAGGASGKVTVDLFAGMAALAGGRRVCLDWSGGDVAALRRALARACPAVAPLLERSAVALGDRYAADDERVAEGSTAAVIPPVSGG